MNINWKDYLLSQGADFTEDSSFAFNEAAVDNKKVNNNDFICDLSQYSTLVVAGDDAKEFMQGQFSNDVDKLDEDHSQLSSFCNRKGRMIANFRLFKYQGNYFFSPRNDLAERSIEHLQTYILRAQVALQDVSEQLIHLGIGGENAEKLLSAFIKIKHQGVDTVSYNDNYVAICVASANNKPRFEIFCDLDHAKKLWQNIADQAQLINSASWDYLNIQAGLPFIDSHTSEEFVPQMANMELINGVSFTKGCFTGQEIVARMHYLGKLKKRCFKINISSESKPVAGSKLFAENARAGQNTGIVIQAEKNPESGFDALAVIQIADTESRLFLNNADGPAVTVGELPYSLEAPE